LDGGTIKRGFCLKADGLTREELAHAQTGINRGRYNYEKKQPAGSEHVNWPL
jgi:hypothetical protein